MAEPEVATKAPESDAVEDISPPAVETAATPSAPRLSGHCTSDRPAPVGVSSTGEITKLADVDVCPLL